MLSRNQLAMEIASRSDDDDCRLILTTDGEFELVPYYSEEHADAFNRLNYVTRWGTYDKGDGFVGIEASKDNYHIDKIMEWANEAWEIHKQSGRTKILNKNS